MTAGLWTVPLQIHVALGVLQCDGAWTENDELTDGKQRCHTCLRFWGGEDRSTPHNELKRMFTGEREESEEGLDLFKGKRGESLDLKLHQKERARYNPEGKKKSGSCHRRIEMAFFFFFFFSHAGLGSPLV